MARTRYSITYEGITYNIEVVRTSQTQSLIQLFGRLDLVRAVGEWPSTLAPPNVFEREKDGEVVIEELSPNEALYIEEIGAFAFDREVGCSTLVLPSNCTTIRNKAFYFNDSITNIQIDYNLHTIEEYAIAGKNSLTEGFIGSSSTYSTESGILYKGDTAVLGKNSNGSISFKAGTTAIGKRAFSFCDNVTSVVLPNSLTSIGEFAFSDCSNLASVTIPSNVVAVGYGAFFGCDSVEKVVLGNGVQALGGLSLSGMNNLLIVKMTDSVTDICSIIGEETFDDFGRRLRIDGEESSVSESVRASWQGTYGALPKSIDIKFYTNPIIGPAFVVHGVVPDSTISDYISQADEALSGSYDIKGWYYDEDLSDKAATSDVVKNYRRGDNGQVIDVDEISLYADYTAVIDFSDIYLTEEKDGKITLTGVKDWEKLRLSGYSIPSIFTVDDKEYEVVRLGNSLFEGGIVGATMTIPKTIRSVGKSAFRNCETLAELIFEEGSKCGTIEALAFSNTHLEGITIPDSVKRIRQGAFYGCEALESITLGAGLVGIGNESGNNHGTFEDCSSLSTVRIGSIEQWLGIDFGNSACNPASNGGSIYIGASLEPLTQLTFQEIGASTTAIKDFSFVGCGSISTVDFSGTNVTKIGQEAFSACESLSSVILSNGRLSDLGRAAFSNCTSLTSIGVPDTITEIGSYSFNACSGLVDVSISNGSRYVSESMFSNCTNLATVAIPSSIRSIKDSAFSGCTGLTSVTFTDPVESECASIGAYAFYACGLTSIGGSGNNAMPLMMQSIGERAFARNKNLVSAILPDGINPPNRNIFEDCPSLPVVRGAGGYGYIGNWIFEDKPSQ